MLCALGWCIGNAGGVNPTLLAVGWRPSKISAIGTSACVHGSTAWPCTSLGRGIRFEDELARSWCRDLNVQSSVWECGFAGNEIHCTGPKIPFDVWNVHYGDVDVVCYMGLLYPGELMAVCLSLLSRS